MSAEFDLPPELSDLEMRLQKLSPITVGINRDEVMFEAGWAAAETRLSHVGPANSHWLWPTTSAVLAASVAVLAFLLHMQHMDTPSVATAEAEPAAPLTSVVQQEQPSEYSPVRIAPRQWPPEAVLLEYRDRALLGDFNEAFPPAAPGDIAVTKAKSVRELMDEFLTGEGTS